MSAILRYLRRKALLLAGVCPDCCIPLEFPDREKPFCSSCHSEF